jgi:hypothetical protein
MTDQHGEVTDVYIYQGDRFIDKLQNVGTYNTADAEQTEEDRHVFIEQRKKISEFNTYVKERSIARVGILAKKEPVPAVEDEEDLVVDLPPIPDVPPAADVTNFSSYGVSQL